MYVNNRFRWYWRNFLFGKHKEKIVVNGGKDVREAVSQYSEKCGTLKVAQVSLVTCG